MNGDEMSDTWMSKAIGKHRGLQEIASAIASAPEFLDLVRQGVKEANQNDENEAGEGSPGGENAIARVVLRGLAEMNRTD